MPLRLMSVLCVLLLSGCTSSEPQNASYAPLAAEPSLQAAPPKAHAASPAPELQNQPTVFPPSDLAELPQSDTAATAVLPPGATNCSTVDGVTLCDAPAESGADDPSADAYNADDALYTN
jgi:hypothetical protein